MPDHPHSYERFSEFPLDGKESRKGLIAALKVDVRSTAKTFP